jgi:hypothetical protein
MEKVQRASLVYAGPALPFRGKHRAGGPQASSVSPGGAPCRRAPSISELAAGFRFTPLNPCGNGSRGSNGNGSESLFITRGVLTDLRPLPSPRRRFTLCGRIASLLV